MVDSGGVYKDGEQIGAAADLGSGPLGWEWWAVASGTISASPPPKIMSNFFASGALLAQVAGTIKGYGELSSCTLMPIGLSFTANTPLVASVDILPGAKIEFDSVKGQLTTNKAYLNSVTRITLSDAKVHQALASAKAVLAEAKSLKAKLDSGALDARVAMKVQS
jgi:hypothetical protein